MLKKLKFYFIGLVPGLLIVFFILNQKGASCSYFPNDRVLAETLTKEFSYTESFKTSMQENKLDEKFIKDSILTNGAVDFDKSNAQKQPCPEYLLNYPSKNPKFEIIYTKCKEKAEFITLNKLR